MINPGEQPASVDAIYLEMKIKHLEFILQAIARMNSSSASVKNFSSAIFAAVISFGVTVEQKSIVLILAPLMIITAGLDAKYLAIERSYRTKYDQVRATNDKMIDFSMSPSGTSSYLNAIVSWSVLTFYASLITLDIIIYAIMTGGLRL